MNAVSTLYYVVVMVTAHDMTCIVHKLHGRSGMFSQVTDHLKCFNEHSSAC